MRTKSQISEVKGQNEERHGPMLPQMRRVNKHCHSRLRAGMTICVRTFCCGDGTVRFGLDIRISQLVIVGSLVFGIWSFQASRLDYGGGGVLTYVSVM
jgi:hypothetical protein